MAGNIVYQEQPNCDVVYLIIGKDWMYLAIDMDLYSRCIIGWSIHKRMAVDLVERAM